VARLEAVEAMVAHPSLVEVALLLKDRLALHWVALSSTRVSTALAEASTAALTAEDRHLDRQALSLLALLQTFSPTLLLLVLLVVSVQALD
jgi:hypothetical protein